VIGEVRTGIIIKRVIILSGIAKMVMKIRKDIMGMGQ
jgi:hypothetical protein